MISPMTISDKLANPPNYLPALKNLAQNVIESTRQIIEQYQQQQLAMKPEDFLYLYSRWLGFIVGQKIIGDKIHLQQLIIDTLHEHAEQGKKLCQIVDLETEQD